jgi:hypothetical protein
MLGMLHEFVILIRHDGKWAIGRSKYDNKYEFISDKLKH